MSHFLNQQNNTSSLNNNHLVSKPLFCVHSSLCGQSRIYPDDKAAQFGVNTKDQMAQMYNYSEKQTRLLKNQSPYVMNCECTYLF